MKFDYRKDKDYFCMDGHIHGSPKIAEKMIEYAIKNGMNAIAFTDFGRTDTFDALRDNGKDILPKNNSVEKINDTLLKIKSSGKPLYVIKGEEIRTKSGDVLGLFMQERIDPGMDSTYTLQNINNQKGIIIFPHLYVKPFDGMGEDNFLGLYNTFRDYPLALESNGQCSGLVKHLDNKVGGLTDKLGLALFGNSDTHGNQRREYEKIGSYYSAIPIDLIDENDLRGSIIGVMKECPKEIKIGGKKNNFFSVLSWMSQLYLGI